MASSGAQRNVRAPEMYQQMVHRSAPQVEKLYIHIKYICIYIYIIVYYDHYILLFYDAKCSSWTKPLNTCTFIYIRTNKMTHVSILLNVEINSRLGTLVQVLVQIQ